MIAFIRAGLEHHDATCPMPARAILLNRGNYELFERNELFGLPLEPRDDIPPKRFRIDCDGSAYGIESEIAEALGEPLTVTPAAPEPIPVLPGRPEAPDTRAPALGRRSSR